MNELKAEVRHKFFVVNKVDKFKTEIDSLDISIWSNSEILYIDICGRKAIEKIEDLVLELFSLFSLYLGGYPKIMKMEVNGQVMDTSMYVGKFDTWEYFIKSDLAICQINESTVNGDVLHNYRNLKQTPLYSMQYLVSSNYKHVIINHKITLLLHIIDGIVSDSIVKPMQTEIKSKYHVQGDKGKYKPKVYYLCKNHFFNYHRKYNCEILSLLQVTQYKFLQIVTDTRNWYSHFLSENKKLDRLKDGAEMLIYFEIVYYTIRLFLISEIDVKANEEFVKEYFYSVHDWVLKIKYEKKSPLKSKTYKIAESFEEMRQMIEEITQKIEEGGNT